MFILIILSYRNKNFNDSLNFCSTFQKLSFFDYKNNKFAKFSKTDSTSTNYVGHNVPINDPYKCKSVQRDDHDIILKNSDRARQNYIEDIKSNSNVLQEGYQNSYLNMKNHEEYNDTNNSGEDNSGKSRELSEALCSGDFLGHCSFNSYDEEEKCGSDNFFVTFDYGYSDSIEEQSTDEYKNDAVTDCDDEHDSINNSDDDGNVTDCDEDDITSSASYKQETNVWLCVPEVKDDEAVFQVHHMKHNVENNEMLLNETKETINKYNALDNRNQNYQKYKCNGDFILEETDENDDDDGDSEQYFFDSLECT